MYLSDLEFVGLLFQKARMAFYSFGTHTSYLDGFMSLLCDEEFYLEAQNAHIISFFFSLKKKLLLMLQAEKKYHSWQKNKKKPLSSA